MNKIFAPDLQIRNLVELNPSLTSDRFVVRSIAKNARLVTLKDFGPHCTTAAVTAPASANIITYLPKAMEFRNRRSVPGSEGDKLAPVLGALRSPRMLFVDEATAWDRVLEAATILEPDILWLAEGNIAPREVALPHGVALGSYRPKMLLKNWGLERTAILASKLGAKTLETALLAFEAEMKRRRGQNKIVFDIEEIVVRDGAYRVERDKFCSWAWTGPGTTTSVLVPLNGASRIRLTFFFFGAKLPVSSGCIEIWVGGERMPVRYFQEDLKIEVELSLQNQNCCLPVELRQARTIMTDDHSRQIGYALHKIMLEACP